ncbi:MAG: HAD family hydrolase [Flavobacteriales bacterium]|nr:HAD family hydrolase [Flavobacteriales bacterium]
MKSRPAIFLDRDGVINRERGEHTWRLEDFEVLPDVPRALLEARNAGYALIVITNQSGIGLGLYDHVDVKALHARLETVLTEAGVHLTDILYCPHHPSGGKCLCRKPGSLLVEKALAKHGIDPSRSVFIGDRDRDIEAAAAVGIRGRLVVANSPLFPLVQEELSRA